MLSYKVQHRNQQKTLTFKLHNAKSTQELAVLERSVIRKLEDLQRKNRKF